MKESIAADGFRGKLKDAGLWDSLLYNREKCARPGGETGRRTGLKIPGSERSVPVQFRSRAPIRIVPVRPLPGILEK